ncbi:MAG: ATP-binding cassette domain-containing protein, partial [Candidatus Latescibacterota bacterium]
MSELVFTNLRKVFPGGVTAVEDFSLSIPSPTMTVLVGPSGCGKTTLLRLIAGLEKPTSGEIHMGEKRLDRLPPKDRDIAMVFQSYALYPHMTVSENLSFGLRLRKISKARIVERVEEVARDLEIADLLNRRPRELSGGQRQRVALGRAIIREPSVFLFDEPLSNLDARLRGEMRAMIKRLYGRLRITSVYVTHDQVEAMTIGELLVVMNEGRIHQVGTPENCYQEPLDTFVASFLGSPPMNFIQAELGQGGGEIHIAGASVRLPAAATAGSGASGVLVGVRPENIAPAPPARPAGEALRLDGRITLEEPLGHETLTHIQVLGQDLVARGPERFAR